MSFGHIVVSLQSFSALQAAFYDASVAAAVCDGTTLGVVRGRPKEKQTNNQRSAPRDALTSLLLLLLFVYWFVVLFDSVSMRHVLPQRSRQKDQSQITSCLGCVVLEIFIFKNQKTVNAPHIYLRIG